MGGIGLVHFFVHLVFKKTNGRAATEADEHQAGFVDDQKKKSGHEKTDCHEGCMVGPPYKSGQIRGENAHQRACQQQDSQ